MTISDAVVYCSNRGPLTAGGSTSEGFTYERTRPNGLIPVIYQAIVERGGEWVFAARSPADKEIARSPAGQHVQVGAKSILLNPVDLPSSVEKGFYDDFSNNVLAKILHYLYDLGSSSELARASWGDYQEANHIFAARLAQGDRVTPIVFHDWHLLLAGGYLRRLAPGMQAPLIYFHHVAWAEPDYFSVLPRHIRESLLSGMLNYDVVGFHAQRWAASFLSCCARNLPSCTIEGRTVHHGGRTTEIVVAPATVDSLELSSEARGALYDDHLRRIDHEAAGRVVVVRVERADIWKNPLRGLLAIERILQRRREYAEIAWFPCILSPTRVWLPDYREYLDECRVVADRINRDFSRSGRKPVTLYIADDPRSPDRQLALAMLASADIVTVTPTFDGLNIVAMEAAAMASKEQVVVVSEGAGIAEVLGRSAIQVNPFDVDDIADGIVRAIETSSGERRERSAAVRSVLTGSRPSDWLAGLLKAAGRS